MKLFKDSSKLETGSISSISLDDESTQNNTTTTLTSCLDGKIIRLNNKTKTFIFPMIYFLTSTIFLLILLLVKILKENETKKSFENFPMHPFPSLGSFKKNHKNIFFAAIILISISGLLNIWFFCSLLLQRFSVPELKSNKLTVHLMFFLGILANLVFLFFAFTPEFLKFENSKIKILRISISMIIFLSFVFFNLLFAALTLNVLMNFKKQIAYNDKRLKRNIKGKQCIVYLTLFLLVLYIFAIFMLSAMTMQSNKEGLKKTHFNLRDNNNKNNKNKKFRSIINSEDSQVNKGFNSEKHMNLNAAAGEKSNFKFKEDAFERNFFKRKFFSEMQNNFLACLKNLVDAILFLFPYLIFFFNSLINLSYYSDIVYLEDIINLIIEKEFFLENDETSNFMADLPI